MPTENEPPAPRHAVRAAPPGTGVPPPVFVLVGWGIVALGAAAASVARSRTVPLAAVVKG